MAWYEVPFGVIERKPYPQDRYQWGKGNWPTLGWVDYTDGNLGITLANRGTPGHRLEDGVINVSLLRSGTKHEWATDPEPLSFDNGKQVYFFSILPHKGDFREGKSYQFGQEINNEFLVCKEKFHSDSLPANKSFLGINAPNIICSTFKLAEDRKGYILRLYETEGKHTEVSLKMSFKIEDGQETDLLEQSDNTRVITKAMDFIPFEIKTLKIKVNNLKGSKLKIAKKIWA